MGAVLPAPEKIDAVYRQIQSYIRRTPTWLWQSDAARSELGAPSGVWVKLEIFQYSGTFKLRGALANVLSLTPAEKRSGVVAVSGGNHAAAVAFAARQEGIGAKVVMPRSASTARIELCRSYGAEVVLAEDFFAAFAMVEEVREREKRVLVHPFEGELTVCGTATVALEFFEDVPDLEVLVVPIGGGGLISGIATVAKRINPCIQVIGVEPEGAPTLFESRAAHEPRTLSKVASIADSLCAPKALPYTFAIVEELVDDIVLVSDDEICAAIALLFADMKLAVEPAAAVATAALRGPLKDRFKGKKIGIIACGSNIDSEHYSEYLRRGMSTRYS